MTVNTEFAVVQRVLADKPAFHLSGKAHWDALPDMLQAIRSLVRPDDKTLEVGVGGSTVIFAASGARHMAISPDADEHKVIGKYCEQIDVDDSQVTFLEGFSDDVLPKHLTGSARSTRIIRRREGAPIPWGTPGQHPGVPQASPRCASAKVRVVDNETLTSEQLLSRRARRAVIQGLCSAALMASARLTTPRDDQSMRAKAALVLSVFVIALLFVIGVRFNSATNSIVSLPRDVSLRQIDGGPHYYANISSQSAWMDKHFLIGAWLEEPLSATDVRYDIAMGNNIYWNLASSPRDDQCNGPCRVNFNVIRVNGMHASAPDVTSQSGSETVAYEGADEPDMDYGPGSSGWNRSGPYNSAACIPSGSKCGYTVVKFFYTGVPKAYGAPGYPVGRKPITQGYGKGVLFRETNAQAAQFMKYSDTLSADSYWMTDSALDVPSQGACALLPASSRQCDYGNGTGLTTAQRALPANYAFNVTRIQTLESLVGPPKPITVDVETGCPGSNGTCTGPAAAKAAAWHAIIAGARGIIWFQHNFGGHCIDFNTFYDGSNPASSNSKYNCQQTPGVTLHDVVKNISAFNHEVASLNSVLLSPFAINYVSVGNADVSVMAKYSNSKFYIFAASGKPARPPANNQFVTFKLAGNYTGPVIVVDEHRFLHVVNGVFTDKFANMDSVHIYQIG